MSDVLVPASELAELKAQLNRIEQALAAPQRLVVSADEARAMTGFKDVTAFYRWAKSMGLHPCKKGHFLADRVKLALHSGEVRRRKSA